MTISAAITVAAIIGKQVCGFCALEKGLNRIAIGIAMIPRGEVTLIFAGIGKSQGIINDVVFSALIIMVIITTRLHRQLSGWQCPKDLPQRRIKTELSYS